MLVKPQQWLLSMCMRAMGERLCQLDYFNARAPAGAHHVSPTFPYLASARAPHMSRTRRVPGRCRILGVVEHVLAPQPPMTMMRPVAEPLQPGHRSGGRARQPTLRSPMRKCSARLRPALPRACEMTRGGGARSSQPDDCFAACRVAAYSAPTAVEPPQAEPPTAATPQPPTAAHYAKLEGPEWHVAAGSASRGSTDRSRSPCSVSTDEQPTVE